MAETCLLAEAAICYPPLFDDIRSIQPRPTETAETVAIAAVAAASEQGATAILVLSTSGETARLISKYRPAVPIITGTCITILSRFCLGSSPFQPSHSKPTNLTTNSFAPGLLPILVP